MAVAVAVTGLTLTGCGDGETTTPVGATDNRGVSVVEPPAPLPAPPSAPRTEAPDFGRNDNIDDGTFSSVCWARWEVARHQLQIGTSKAAPEKGESAAAALEAALPAVEAALRRGEGTATAAGRPFVEHFRDAARRARADMAGEHGTRQEALARHFDWGSFPGAQDYGNQAEDAPGCVRP